MADLVADAALGFIYENLKQVVIDNYELLHRVEGRIKSMLTDLEELRMWVTRANINSDELEEFLMKEIRRLFNEVEDAVDSYIVLVYLHRSKPAYSRFVIKLQYLRQLRNLAREIDYRTYRLRDLMEDAIPVLRRYSSPYPERLEFRAQEIVPTYLKREKAPSVVEDNIVGFEDALSDVITLLSRDSRYLEVISIVGKVGIGKTTLAKKVLTDPRIQSQFQVTAFVSVSQRYDTRKAFLNILRSFTQVSYELVMVPEAELAVYVSKQLETRRYLIIMDDVREREDWDKLKVALSNNKNSSKVLITTRKKYVAAHANPSIKPYYLSLLRLKESRELLRSKVFGENSCPEELEEYEFEIAIKCGGLPLAILLTAGYLLINRESVDWWKRVVEYQHEYNLGDEEHIKDLINLCYSHLPYHLKLCFLYLGVLPMGFEIPVSTLLRLWIAEQFIMPEGDMTFEELAEQYLEDLVSRNLVTVGKRRHDGRIKTCQIYETLQDFCKKKAVEENFFQDTEMAKEGFFLFRYLYLDDQRRLCIGSNVLEYLSNKPSWKRLRSFLAFGHEESALSPKHMSSFSKAFSLLRVLEARSLSFSRFPLELCKLILLKYLAISGSFKTIPSEMSTLQNMQTLIVRTVLRTLEIRADIWKMKQLRNLDSNASMDLLSPSKEKDENRSLQILSTISSESCKEDVFCRTPCLKKLGISGKLATLFEANPDFFYLSRLDFLENLKLLNDDSNPGLQRLPSERHFPRRLRQLTLINTLLPWDQMSTLGKLEYLEVLKLKDKAFVGDAWETEIGGFHSLKILHIWRTNLVRWEASKNQFPVLRGLVVKHCTELQSLPPVLGDIPSLEFIDLEDTNPVVASSARKIKESRLLKEEQLGSRRDFRLSVHPPDH